MIEEAWQRLNSRGPGWYWIGNHLRNGDLYHACSLAEVFRETHGRNLPIYLSISHPNQVQVTSLYPDCFVETVLVPEFPLLYGEWEPFFKARGGQSFGHDRPILLHPHVNEETLRVDRFNLQHRLPYIELYKHLLHVSAGSEPAPPAFDPTREAEARELCRRNGMAQGRAVVFFPYAQSFAVEALDHFAALAKRLQERGLQVFTSIAGPEQPAPGTQPITIPFGILREVAEHAGWIVAVRSGICDITSSARCKKSFIYRHGRELPLWSVASMQLCRDAVELAFDFGSQEPEQFCDVVLGERSLRGVGATQAGLSQLLAESAGAKLLSLSITHVQHRPATSASRVLEAAGHLGSHGTAFRLMDVPRRNHPRWEPLVNEFLSTLVATAGDRFYTCRDGRDSDFFEEMDARSLLEGRYRAARYFHTVLVSSGPLESLLPGDEAEWVAPVTQPVLDAAITFDETSRRGAGYAAFVNGRQPFSQGGVQLLEGWHAPEDWGVWTIGPAALLKFAFDETPQGTFSFELAGLAPVSERFPRLEYSVKVNGHRLVTSAFELGAEPRIAVHVPETVAVSSRVFLVEIEFLGIQSPREQGTGDDPRLLGLGLQWMRIAAPVRPSPHRPAPQGVHQLLGLRIPKLGARRTPL